MQLTFRSKAHESSQYRPDIDGLRAIAVLSVVLYHAGLRSLPGGFVGVDVFFVISGYLITSVIEKDIERGLFSFWTFYERRMRRIFPALFTVAFACTLFGAVLFPTQQFIDFGKSLLALTGFVSNIYFKQTSVGAGYFAPASGTQFLLHTWSLSVEEQFYVLFPILLLLLTRFGRTTKQIALAVLIAVSFGFSVWIVKSSPIAAFYYLPGRAWELLLGAWLALKPLPLLKSAVARSLAGLAGVAAIAYGVLYLADGVPFPGLNALYPCVGAGLVLYAGESGPSFVKRALGLPPLVFLGAISYSLYLWHWPMLSLAKYYYAEPALPVRFTVYPLLASFILAVLSFEFIESPFRRRVPTGSRPPGANVVVGRGIAVSATFAAIALAIVLTHGLPRRFKPDKLRVMDENYEKKAESAFIGGCGNFQTELKEYSDAAFCSFGHSSKNMLVWGDSHGYMLFPLLTELQQKHQLGDRGLVLAIAGSCAPAENYNLNPLTRPGFHCDRFAKYVMMRAAQPDIDTVFLEFSPWWMLQDGTICADQDGRCLTGAEAGHRVFAELSEHILTLKASGKRVIVGLAFPIYTTLIPDLQIRRVAMGRFANLSPWPYDLTNLIDWDELRRIAVRDGAEVYAPRDTLCPQGNCIYQVNTVSLYSDENHIAPSQLWFLRDGLLKAIKPRS